LFLHFLLNRQVRSNLRAPIRTSALTEQVLHSLAPHERWIIEALEERKIEVRDKDDQVEMKIEWEQETYIPISVFYKAYFSYMRNRQMAKSALGKKNLKIAIEKFLRVEIKSHRSRSDRLYILPDPEYLSALPHLSFFFE
jgi:hypothetical protein